MAADFVAFAPLLATTTNSLNRTPLAVECLGTVAFPSREACGIILIGCHPCVVARRFTH